MEITHLPYPFFIHHQTTLQGRALLPLCQLCNAETEIFRGNFLEISDVINPNCR